jgi:hypothetical protein
MEKNQVAELCYHLPEAAHERLCDTREETFKSNLSTNLDNSQSRSISRTSKLALSNFSVI